MIRLANSVDVPAMAVLWHERMTLQQRSDRRYKIAPNGQALWSTTVREWLVDDQFIIYVAHHESQLVGYIIGCIQASPPGVIPEQVGAVLEIVVGAHTNQSGLGRQLLDPVRRWFRERGLMRMIAYVPRRQPVEQAFWRALGAAELTDMMWMNL